MRGISFYGIYQLWDKVMPLAELHVNIGKSILATVAESNQSVIQADNPNNDQDENTDYN